MIVNQEAVKNALENVKPATLVAATKYIDAKEVKRLEEAGCTIFGENRVQDFLKKYEAYEGEGVWHFIGTLQCNKVKYIIDKVTLIHSVNSYKLIDEIEKQAIKHNRIMDILLQVNIANEESKHGFKKEEMEDVMKYLVNCPHINPRGLMMMAPHIEPEQTRVYFKETKELLEHLQELFPIYNFTELSMGMSNDYKVAIEEGSTMVRLGHALFDE